MHNKNKEYIKNPFNHPSLLAENSAHMTRHYHVSRSVGLLHLLVRLLCLLFIPIHSMDFLKGKEVVIKRKRRQKLFFQKINRILRKVPSAG